MNDPIEYRPLAPGEEVEVSDLVVSCFHEFVAGDFDQEGTDEFLRYARPEAVAERLESDHIVLVARARGRPIGMIEIRRNEHVSLLFVDRGFQGRGVARQLLGRALELARSARPDLDRVTVHASRYAVEIYRRLGFEPSGPETIVNGIIFTPMVRVLGPKDA
jgi:GNAT superfamily N-acetyltransferase